MDIDFGARYCVFCVYITVIIIAYSYGFHYIIAANGSSFSQCGANVDSDPSPSSANMSMGIADEMLKQKIVESVLSSGKRIGEQTNLEKLDWFAEQLVLEHQRMSCRIAPTVAFKQATAKPS